MKESQIILKFIFMTPLRLYFWTDLKTTPIRRDLFFGARKIKNFVAARLLFFRGLHTFLYWINQKDVADVQFFPQGVVTWFYGSLRLVSRIYLFAITFYNIGRGFNEYSREKNYIYMFRIGRFGTRRWFETFYSRSEISSLQLNRKKSRINMINTEVVIRPKTQKGICLLPNSSLEEYYSLQGREELLNSLADYLGVNWNLRIH